MFKKGGVIQRKLEFYNDYWRSRFCSRKGKSFNDQFTVISYEPRDNTVRFKDKFGDVFGVYDFKTELVDNITLENE